MLLADSHPRWHAMAFFLEEPGGAKQSPTRDLAFLTAVT
jgi:hypothetical protein